MAIKFSKYHGCGNDFICVDGRGLTIDYALFAKRWCQRGFAVGADGVLFLEESAIADFKMTVVNADGSIPEMCGNGLRCFVAYLIHQALTTNTVLRIETLAGVLVAEIKDAQFPNLTVSIQMGSAAFQASLPTTDFQFETQSLAHELAVDDVFYSVTPISMGNPHCVIFVDDVDAINLPVLGPLIEHHPYFPNRVNVEFVEVLTHSKLKLRVWERGVGETNACGTGACAAAVAGYLTERSASDAQVELKGGTLSIAYDQRSKNVIMSGPATFVFESNLPD